MDFRHFSNVPSIVRRRYAAELFTLSNTFSVPRSIYGNAQRLAKRRRLIIMYGSHPGCVAVFGGRPCALDAFKTTPEKFRKISAFGNSNIGQNYASAAVFVYDSRTTRRRTSARLLIIRRRFCLRTPPLTFN